MLKAFSRLNIFICHLFRLIFVIVHKGRTSKRLVNEKRRLSFIFISKTNKLK